MQELNSLNQSFSVPGLNSLLHDVSECCLRSNVQVLKFSNLVLFVLSSACFPFLIQPCSTHPLPISMGLPDLWMF